MTEPLVDFTDYICGQCDWSPREEDNFKAREKVIDHIFEHTIRETYFYISREEAKELRDFLYANGYVSYEFHPKVIKILRDLDRFLEEVK